MGHEEVGCGCGAYTAAGSQCMNGIRLKTKYQEYYMTELAQQQQVPTVCLELWVSVRRDIGVQYPA